MAITWQEEGQIAYFPVRGGNSNFNAQYYYERPGSVKGTRTTMAQHCQPSRSTYMYMYVNYTSYFLEWIFLYGNTIIGKRKT